MSPNCRIDGDVVAVPLSGEREWPEMTRMAVGFGPMQKSSM
jgi:hypothetical protein